MTGSARWESHLENVTWDSHLVEAGAVDLDKKFDSLNFKLFLSVDPAQQDQRRVPFKLA